MANIRQMKKYLFGFVASLAIAVMGLYLVNNKYFRGYEASALDFFFSVRPAAEQPTGVVIVMIDEESLGDFEYYDPLPRQYIAELIDSLAVGQPKLIALDIVFFDRMKKLGVAGDSALIDAMKRAGNVVSVSKFYEDADGEIGRHKLPDPFFGDALRKVGFANLPLAVSGGEASVRRIYFAKKFQEEVLPAFSLVVYAESRGLDADALAEAMAENQWSADLPEIPFDYQDQTLINYAGPSAYYEKQADGTFIQKREGTFRTFRSSRITAGNFPKQLFRNKIVFVGNGSEFAADQFITPYYGNRFNYVKMPGAEVHANAYLTLQNQRFISRPGNVLTFFLLFILTFVTTVATIRFDFRGEISIVASLVVGIWIVGYLLFSGADYWIPCLALAFVTTFTYFVVSVFQAFTEEKDKRQLKMAFQRYVPPAVVEEVMKNPDMAGLKGQEKEVSILFSDIEGFTTISEKLPPTVLIEMLNEYLETMTLELFNEDGTLDKYIGDAIVSIFGAPLPVENHPLKAARAGLAMSRKLEQLQKDWQSRNKWPDQKIPMFRTRIGINSGNVIVGNIGSQIRIDYTGIGDAMNLSARLESANKQYGTYIMISEFTNEQVKDQLLTRFIDHIIVRGKTRPVKVYELISERDSLKAEQEKEHLSLYEDGIQYYLDRNWTESIKCFESVLKQRQDRLSLLYIDRCRSYIDSPPPEDWAGVYELTSK